jgi:cell division protein FtsB
MMLIVRKKFKLKALITLLIVIYVSYTLINQERILVKSKKQITQSLQELSNIKDNNLKLLDEVKESSTDTFKERLAREKLGLVKDGETTIVNEGKK